MRSLLLVLLLFVTFSSHAQECSVTIDTSLVTFDYALAVANETEYVIYDVNQSTVNLVGAWSWVYLLWLGSDFVTYVGYYECPDEVDENISSIPDNLINYTYGDQVAGVFLQPDGTYHVYCVATGQIVLTVPERPELYTPCEGVSMTVDGDYYTVIIGDYEVTLDTLPED